MADRIVEMAMPLLIAGHMTSRGLALNLRWHIDIHIRRVALNTMAREYERRSLGDLGEQLTDKDELMALAQKKEAFLLGSKPRSAQPAKIQTHDLRKATSQRPCQKSQDHTSQWEIA